MVKKTGHGARGPVLEKVEYWRERKPPTLKQFIWREAMKLASDEARVIKGTTINPETGYEIPRSALHIKEALKDKTVEDLMTEHPEWVAEYKKMCGGASCR